MIGEASVTAKLAATEALLDQARGEEERLRAQWSGSREEIARLEREVSRLRDLANGSTRVSLASVRDVVMKFRGGFTDSEIASALGVPVSAVKKHFKEMQEGDVIIDTGERFNRKTIYEFAAPTEAGSSFEAQQRLEPEPESRPGATAQPVPTVHAPRGIHKDIRRVVKEAMKNGWSCDMDGSGHYVLTRGKQKVGFASTPKNPSIEAMHLKRNLARAERVG